MRPKFEGGRGVGDGAPVLGVDGLQPVALTVGQLRHVVADAVRRELDRAATVAVRKSACETGSFFENRRATDGGSSEEEPMYKKIYGPYCKRGRFHLHLHFLDGRKPQYKTFTAEE